VEVAEATEEDLKMDIQVVQVVVVPTNLVLQTRVMEALVQPDKVMQEEIPAAVEVVKYQAAAVAALEEMDRMALRVVAVVRPIDLTIQATVEMDFKIQFQVLLCGTLEAAEVAALVRVRIFKEQMALVVDKPLTVVVGSVN
jgi:hypothetical protein